MLMKMTVNDHDLLRQFAEDQSQDAFTALVRRHVDLVYSAALRQVRSPDLAGEVTQSVFGDLARNADKLRPGTILTAWLYQVTRRTAIDVVRREARRQARERLVAEMTAMNATPSVNDWTQIEPMLDEAMDALDETDRAAVLLRFFENKSLREVGASLGTSGDAAQKRVTRAVDRLREFFARRGVAVGAGGLIAVISANAVQAAPAALAATVSAVAATAATVIHSSTAILATKEIAMITLNKIVVTASLAAAVGAGIYEAHEASAARTEVAELKQQQTPLVAQIQQLQQERADATNQLAALLAENAQLKSNSNETELLRLRGKVGALRNQLNNQTNETGRNDQASEQQLKEKLSRQADFIRDDDKRKNDAGLISAGMSAYVFGKGGKLPNDFTQLTNVVSTHFPQGTVSPEYFSQFEFMNLGTQVLIFDSRGATVNPDMANKLVEFREKVARQAPDGYWYRIYGLFGLGPQVVTATSSDGNFDAWEKENTYTPPSNPNQ